MKKEMNITYSLNQARTELDRAKECINDEFSEAQHYTMFCLITLKKLYNSGKIETTDYLPEPRVVLSLNPVELNCLHKAIEENYFEPFLPKTDFPEVSDEDLEGIVTSEKVRVNMD